jgi:dephospho-CoA kinase
MIIIGITGTLGAGKGTIVDYLTGKMAFRHFSVRGFISEEIVRRGLRVNRDTLTFVANDLRADHSPSWIVDQLFMRAQETGKNCVIESIRTPGEVLSLREKGRSVLFAVDADPKLRFERIRKRASETDQIDFETFIQNEKREMGSTDPNKQNIGKVVEMADYVFDNNGEIEELESKVGEVLERIQITKDK